MVIECSFGRLKGRFRLLQRIMDINIKDLPSVIYCCFVLHNFCERNNQSISQEEVNRAMSYDVEFQPVKANQTGFSDVADGKTLRDLLKRFFDP